jgi:hypothetical protein
VEDSVIETIDNGCSARVPRVRAYLWQLATRIIYNLPERSPTPPFWRAVTQVIGDIAFAAAHARMYG